MTPKDEMRVLVGLVVQPIVAGVATFVLFPLFDDRVYGALSMAFATGLAAVFVTLLGALPAIAWCSRGPVTFTRTAVAGAILGIVPVLVLMLLVALHGEGVTANSSVTNFILDGSRAGSFGATIGLVCATVFWWVAGRRLSMTARP